MHENIIGREIQTLMYKTNMSHQERVFFLFRLLKEYIGAEEFNDICMHKLIPELVQYVSYFHQVVRMLRDKFVEYPIPKFDDNDFEKMMQLLHGGHKGAARYFLDAINKDKTDEQMCEVLRKLNINVSRDNKVNADAITGTFANRQTVIFQLIRYRADIQASAVFNILLGISNTFTGMPGKFAEITNKITESMISRLARVPNIISHIKEKLRNDTEYDREESVHDFTFEPPPQPDGDDVKPTKHSKRSYVYATKMPSFTPTNNNELSSAFIDANETKHQSSDLHELLCQLQNLA